MRISPRLATRWFLNNPVVEKIRRGTRYMFGKQLLLTNIGISAGLSGVGDCILQNCERYNSDDRHYNGRRTLNMVSAGATVGAFCHYWYIYLDNLFPGKRSLNLAMKKMLVDQIIGSPIQIGIFFVTMAVVERSSTNEFLHELRCKSWKLYAAEWIIWPPAQLINFFWLPLKYRVLYDNSISICYDIFTSYVKHDMDVDCEGSISATVAAAEPVNSNFPNPLTKHPSPAVVPC